MADHIPVRLRSTDPSRIGEFEEGDTLGISHGGTGKTTAATALAALGGISIGAHDAHVADTNNPHGVTIAQIGAAPASQVNDHHGNTNNPHAVTAAQVGALTAAQSNTVVNQHANRTDNPHAVTAAQVGAITVSDHNSHVSNTANPHGVTATQIGAATQAQVNTHVVNTGNPHSVTAAQVGAATEGQHDAHVADTNNPHNVTAAQVGAASQVDLDSHRNRFDNPHNVTAAHVGAPTQAQHDGHVNATDNPHGVTAVQIGAPTLAQLNSHSTDTNNPHSVTAAQVGAVALSHVGASNGVTPLDTNQKIPLNYLPASAVSTVSVVADSTERANLTVQEGDEAIQLDDGSHWIFDGTSWNLRPGAGPGVGDVLGKASTSQIGEMAIYADTVGKEIDAGSGLHVTAGGEINNRDIAADGTALDTVITGLSSHSSDTNNPHGVTLLQLGAASQVDLDAHAVNTANPHGVTAAQSGAYTTAQVDSLLGAHEVRVDNPHAVTAAQVGSYTKEEVDSAILAGTGGSTFLCSLLSTAQVDLNTVLGVQIPWDTQVVVDTAVFNHAAGVNNHQIEIIETGVYLITFKLNGKLVRFGRKNPIGYLKINGTDELSSKTYAFARNSANPYASISMPGQVYLLNANDTVQVHSKRGGDFGELQTLPGEVSLTLMQLRRI